MRLILDLITRYMTNLNFWGSTNQNSDFGVFQQFFGDIYYSFAATLFDLRICVIKMAEKIEKISTKMSVLQFDTRPKPRLFESPSLRFRQQSQFPFRNVLRANFQIGFWDNLLSKVGQNCQKLWVCFDKCHDNFTAIWGSPSLGTFNTLC